MEHNELIDLTRTKKGHGEKEGVNVCATFRNERIHAICVCAAAVTFKRKGNKEINPE